MAKFRPMKGVKVEPSQFKDLNYPLFASVKLDGIRAALWPDGSLLSSSNKSIPNEHIKNILKEYSKELGASYILDGELLVGETFQNCTSGIMSKSGTPDFTFYIFDAVNVDNINQKFLDRSRVTSILPTNINIKIVEQRIVLHRHALLCFYHQAINDGHEGIILRSPDGPYKYGRGTLKEQYMLKVKPFEDSEARIISLEEQYSNLNEAKTNELGLSSRSSSKENKIAADTLGAFVVEDIYSGVQFHVGTGLGLTSELRKKIWENKDNYLGKIIKYKSQKIGTKEKPRIPVFIGFRDEVDL